MHPTSTPPLSLVLPKTPPALSQVDSNNNADALPAHTKTHQVALCKLPQSSTSGSIDAPLSLPLSLPPSPRSPHLLPPSPMKAQRPPSAPRVFSFDPRTARRTTTPATTQSTTQVATQRRIKPQPTPPNSPIILAHEEIPIDIELASLSPLPSPREGVPADPEPTPRTSLNLPALSPLLTPITPLIPSPREVAVHGSPAMSLPLSLSPSTSPAASPAASPSPSASPSPLGTSPVARISTPRVPQQILDYYLKTADVDHIHDPHELWVALEQMTQPQRQAEDNVETTGVLPYSSKTHRFRNIPSPRQNIVMIDEEPIHAHYVSSGDGRSSGNGRIFIASQYPQEPRRDPTARERFWKCACKHGSIIDLTQIEELEPGKGVSPYYPISVGESITYGQMSVTCVDIVPASPLFPDIWICFYNVEQLSDNVKIPSQSKPIQRIHYCAWKDHSVASLDRLAYLVQLLETREDLHIVHCKAGVGRTGTLITAYFLMKEIKRGLVTRENLHSFLLSLISHLRMQRGSFFVQKREQLEQLLDYGKFMLQVHQLQKLEEQKF